MKNGKSIQLFEDWFERDDNSIPPTYNLRTISSKLYHYHDNENLELQKRDRDSWWKIFEELQLLLRLGSSKCSEKGTMTKEQTKKYFISGFFFFHFYFILFIFFFPDFLIFFFSF